MTEHTPEPSSPDLTKRLVGGSLLFFPFLAILFWISTPLGFWGAIYITILLELLPAMAVAQLPLVEEDAPLPRIPVYVSSTVLILVMGWGAWLVGRGELGPVAMGLSPVSWPTLALWSGGLTAAALVMMGLFLVFRRLLGLRETPLLAQLLPRTGQEKGLFVALSLAAGWGEEMAYRGFLVPALALMLGGVWPAAILSSAVFGLLHAYQGLLGIVRTALLGLVLAGSLILTGSLWPAIVAHAILDVVAGVLLGEALVKD
jgi:membrane protease YdiL (CAAX protease family)